MKNIPYFLPVVYMGNITIQMHMFLAEVFTYLMAFNALHIKWSYIYKSTTCELNHIKENIHHELKFECYHSGIHVCVQPLWFTSEYTSHRYV